MTTPTPQEGDEAFRRRMAQSTESKAQDWTALDRSAQEQTREVEEAQRKLSGREDGSRLAQADGRLTQLRDRRDDLLRQGAPSLFRRREREEWFKDFEAVTEQVNEAHASWKHEVKASTPQALEKQRERIAERQAERDRAEEQHRGIEKLPSEREASVASMLDKLRARADNVQQTWAPALEIPSINAWRQGRQPKQAMVGRLGYAQYAATAKQEAEFMKNYEEQWNRTAQSR
ncbi:MAG: hypothetical protein KF800_00230 [Lysobacter sp.]|nr:hypothetical protein [Xanthomonadaceae bacterium]MBX3710378.1 hypothetical protein [Lysobacter sp.]